jgi:hypothetical protein
MKRPHRVPLLAILCGSILMAVPGRGAVATEGAMLYLEAARRVEHLDAQARNELAYWVASPEHEPPRQLREVLGDRTWWRLVQRATSASSCHFEVADPSLLSRSVFGSESSSILFQTLGVCLCADAVDRARAGDDATACSSLRASYVLAARMIASPLRGAGLGVLKSAGYAFQNMIARGAIDMQAAADLRDVLGGFDEADPLGIVRALEGQLNQLGSSLRGARELDVARWRAWASMQRIADEERISSVTVEDLRALGNVVATERAPVLARVAAEVGHPSSESAAATAIETEDPLAAGMRALLQTSATRLVLEHRGLSERLIAAPSRLLERIASGEVTPDRLENAAYRYAEAAQALVPVPDEERRRVCAILAGAVAAPTESDVAAVRRVEDALAIIGFASGLAHCDFAVLRLDQWGARNDLVLLPEYVVGMFLAADYLLADRTSEDADRCAATIIANMLGHIASDRNLSVIWVGRAIADRATNMLGRAASDPLLDDETADRLRQSLQRWSAARAGSIALGEARRDIDEALSECGGESAGESQPPIDISAWSAPRLAAATLGLEICSIDRESRAAFLERMSHGAAVVGWNPIAVLLPEWLDRLPSRLRTPASLEGFVESAALPFEAALDATGDVDATLAALDAARARRLGGQDRVEDPR